MFEIESLGHINVVVDDINTALSHYESLFGVKKVQIFPHFQNSGFAKSAGFMQSPEEVDVSIAFVSIESAGIFIELMEYHNPAGYDEVKKNKTNDLGGPRHICLRVKNIDEAFQHIKNHKDTSLISDHAEYAPFKIDNIKPNQFSFCDTELESNLNEKNKACDIVGQIRYFYFIDKYGVQWEFEEGHSDIGSED